MWRAREVSTTGQSLVLTLVQDFCLDDRFEIHIFVATGKWLWIQIWQLEFQKLMKHILFFFFCYPYLTKANIILPTQSVFKLLLLWRSFSHNCLLIINKFIKPYKFFFFLGKYALNADNIYSKRFFFFWKRIKITFLHLFHLGSVLRPVPEEATRRRVHGAACRSVRGGREFSGHLSWWYTGARRHLANWIAII